MINPHAGVVVSQGHADTLTVQMFRKQNTSAFSSTLEDFLGLSGSGREVLVNLAANYGKVPVELTTMFFTLSRSF
jgi:hypothetical protein